MKVLITGNLGFVGSVTEKLFKEKGLETVGFDILERKDIRDLVQLEQIVQQVQPDRILHLAAVARFAEADKDSWACYETNIRGSENVALVANKYHIPVVYASTGSVYMPIKRNPPITEEFEAYGNSNYGCDKRRGEIIFQRGRSLWIILRYAHLYGKEKRHHGLIGGFLERIERGLSPELYGGKQSNDFTYILDVAEANYLACTASWDKWNQIYNIGTGEEITAEDAGKLICEIAGWKGKVENKEMREVDPQRFVYDTTKAKRILGFKAKYNFKEGLTDMMHGESFTKLLIQVK